MSEQASVWEFDRPATFRYISPNKATGSYFLVEDIHHAEHYMLPNSYFKQWPVSIKICLDIMEYIA